MSLAFLIACIGGMAALIVLPHSKNRMHRLLSRGGAAAIFGIGLFGSVFSLLAG